MRNFNVGKEKFTITNTIAVGDITDPTYKYDVNIWVDKYNSYQRVFGCNTLSEGKEEAEYYVTRLESCE